MALLDYVTEEAATGEAREFFESRSDRSGLAARYADLGSDRRSLYTQIRLNNPGVLAAQNEFSSAVFASGLVDEDLFEVVMVAVAQANDCDYCAGSHREKLELLLGMEEATIASVAEGDFNVLDERERVVAEFATECIEDPHRIDGEDLDRLRAVGFDDGDVIQLLGVVGHCNTANLIVNALDVHPADLAGEFPY